MSKQVYHPVSFSASLSLVILKSDIVMMTNKRSCCVCLRISAEVAVLAIVIAIFCALGTFPTIIFALFVRPKDSAVKYATDVQAMSNDSCSAEVYSGTLCRDILLEYQSCIPALAESNNIYIIVNRSTSTQEEIELNGKFLLSSFEFVLIKKSCKSVVLPLFCLYYFGLCDGNKRTYLPSRSDCTYITTKVCHREVKFAARFVGPDILPQCDSLPEDSFTSLCAGNNISNSSIQDFSTLNCSENFYYDEQQMACLPMNSSIPVESTLNCSDNFYYDEQEMICLPECEKFTPYRQEFTQITDAFIILCCILSIVATIVILIVICFKPKRMLKFPSVLVVNTTLTIVFLDIVLLIGYTDRPYFFCNSQNELTQYRTATPFCSITWNIFMYVMFQMPLWLLVHTLSLFWGIMFPFHFKRSTELGRMKILHMIVLPVGIILPCSPSICLYLVYSGVNFYRLSGLPPFCFPNKTKVAYYAIGLPISIMVVTVAILQTVMLRKILKSRKRSSRAVSSRTPEIKLLILLSYHVIVTLLTILSLCAVYFELFTYNLERIKLLACEREGVQSGGEACNRSNIDKTAHPGLFTSTIAAISVLPIVNLTYAINVQELKTLWARLRRRWATEV